MGGETVLNNAAEFGLKVRRSQGMELLNQGDGLGCRAVTARIDSEPDGRRIWRLLWHWQGLNPGRLPPEQGRPGLRSRHNKFH